MRISFGLAAATSMPARSCAALDQQVNQSIILTGSPTWMDGTDADAIRAAREQENDTAYSALAAARFSVFQPFNAVCRSSCSRLLFATRACEARHDIDNAGRRAGREAHLCILIEELCV